MTQKASTMLGSVSFYKGMLFVSAGPFTLSRSAWAEEKVAAEFENHGEVPVDQSKYLGGGVCAE